VSPEGFEPSTASLEGRQTTLGKPLKI